MRTWPIISFMALCLSTTAGFAQKTPRGGTEALPAPATFISVGRAERVEPADGHRLFLAPSRDETSYREDWRATDSVTFDAYVPALGYTGVRFDRAGRRLEMVSSASSLTTAARAAVARSPRWLRVDLEHTLRFLPGMLQNNLAAVIDAAPEKMIDEVAFAIAHSSPAFLLSPYCYPQMFRDNAESIYAHDPLLPYVEIVDRGAPGDDDYYSTVRYWRVDKDSNRVQIEVPRDIYYWYIVHPKITDEISTYVDPEAKESTSAIKPPPQGKFWRDFLFTATDPVPDTTGVDYPILRDVVQQCEVLWADRGAEKGAVLEIGKWIRDVMVFGSETERPHQPVRIYDLHLGRCGEHGDITAAAARACLIPCREISSISTDHVWNEFWDEQWWQWEPVNNSQKNPLVYSEGWGKKFGTVMARRSDGVFHPVTDMYAKETCTLEIQAKDASGAPVDGAVVMIAMRVDQSIYIDTYGATGSDGIARFILGKGNDYFARFDSPNAGSVPAASNQVTALMTNAQPGEHYAYQLRSNVSKPQLRKDSDILPLTDDISDFGIALDATVVSQATRWNQPFDDIRAVEPSVFYCEEGTGVVDVSIIQKDEFAALRDKLPYRISDGMLNAQGTVNVANWDINGTDDFYLLLINRSNANNPVRVSATARLYFSSLLDAATLTPAAGEFALTGCYPSPVTGGSAVLTFAVPSQSGTTLSMDLHDVLGRKQRTQSVALAGTGVQTALLDTRGLRPGCYLLRIQGGDGVRVERLIQIQ